MAIYREALEQDAQYSAARAALSGGAGKTASGPGGAASHSYFSGVRRRQLIDRIGAPEVTIDNQSLTVTATQPIYRKENFVIYEQAKIQVAQADSQFILASQDLILRVAQAYFDILTAQVNIEVRKPRKRPSGEQLELAKRNFQVGTATIVDTYEAQARYDLTLSQEIAARNDLEVRRRPAADYRPYSR